MRGLALLKTSLKIQSFKQDEARTKNVDAAYDLYVRKHFL